MDSKEKLRDEVLARAEKLLYYNELLIEQCEQWLSTEEGNRNMELRIMEEKKRKKENHDKLVIND
jgi:hypothetical protein